MKIGRPVFRQMSEASPDYISSDCPIAGRHIYQGIGEHGAERRTRSRCCASRTGSRAGRQAAGVSARITRGTNHGKNYPRQPDDAGSLCQGAHRVSRARDGAQEASHGCTRADT